MELFHPFYIPKLLINFEFNCLYEMQVGYINHEEKKNLGFIILSCIVFLCLQSKSGDHESQSR